MENVEKNDVVGAGEESLRERARLLIIADEYLADGKIGEEKHKKLQAIADVAELKKELVSIAEESLRRKKIALLNKSATERFSS